MLTKSKLVEVNSEGQITIPKEFREEYKLLENEKIVLVPTKDGVLMKPRVPMSALRGLLKDELYLEEAIKDIKEARKAWSI
ncbi:MAG: AbrB/MazE/SpoVT family DNA-binding domain-containing protein [Methanosarcinales archaeon]